MNVNKCVHPPEKTMENERAFKVYKKCALSDLQKTNKKKIHPKSFWGLHMQVYPPGWLSSSEGRESVNSCCLCHPSWMTNSLYGASVNRQPFFPPCFKVQSEIHREPLRSVDDLHSTVSCLWTLQTGTHTHSNVSRQTRKTSQSSYAWKKGISLNVCKSTTKWPTQKPWPLYCSTDCTTIHISWNNNKKKHYNKKQK